MCSKLSLLCWDFCVFNLKMSTSAGLSWNEGRLIYLFILTFISYFTDNGIQTCGTRHIGLISVSSHANALGKSAIHLQICKFSYNYICSLQRPLFMSAYKRYNQLWWDKEQSGLSSRDRPDCVTDSLHNKNTTCHIWYLFHVHTFFLRSYRGPPGVPRGLTWDLQLLMCNRRIVSLISRG